MQLTDSFILQRSITNNNELILYKNGNNLGDYVPYDDKKEEMTAANEANGLTNRTSKKRRSSSSINSNNTANTTKGTAYSPGNTTTKSDIGFK